jgi:hypothetical protein
VSLLGIAWELLLWESLVALGVALEVTADALEKLSLGESLLLIAIKVSLDKTGGEYFFHL